MILFIGIQGYFSMMEMALVSFNRVRLQYYIAQDKKYAMWISRLLSQPTILFGTTLIGVNASLQIGSECARRFYASLGLSPDFAPISQIILVVIFAELTPMFAARLHAEHVSRLGIRLLYFFSWVLYPAIWVLKYLTRLVNLFIKSSPSFVSYLTREELQRAIEAREEKRDMKASRDFSAITNNIFALKMKSPKDLMVPLSDIVKMPDHSSINAIKEVLSHRYVPFIALYHEEEDNIFGILFTRDLLRATKEVSVRNLARSTWFVTDKNSIHQILKQFRCNAQQLAVILDDHGKAKGIITLDSIVHEIFHANRNKTKTLGSSNQKKTVHIDRSFPSHMRIEELNRQYNLTLPNEHETLEDLMADALGHHPKKGDSVKLEGFTISLVESPLMVDKTIHIKSN